MSDSGSSDIRQDATPKYVVSNNPVTINSASETRPIGKLRNSIDRSRALAVESENAEPLT